MAWDYTQTGDPGAVGAGKSWYNPVTGDIKYRNSSNTQWKIGGNTDYDGLNLVPTITGFALSDAHDFATSVKKGGVELATQADVAGIYTSIMSSIADRIQEGLATSYNSLRVSDYVATKYTFIDVADGHSDNYTITLAKPTFTNGRTAADNECLSLITFTKIVWKSGETEVDYILTKVTETTWKLRTINGSSTNKAWAAQIGGLVIAVRKQ